jgi:hypothetical protein
VTPERYGWQEDERVVPAYAITQGRTRSAGEELPLETLVTSTELAILHEPALQTEMRAIVTLAALPISVVEIGARLGVPLGVARVLVSDLAAAGYLRVAIPAVGDDGRPGREVLGRLLEGLRAR